MQFNNREDIIQLTPMWEGERLPDGRPHVPKEDIDRLRKLTLEEVWRVSWNKLYNYQFQDGFRYVHDENLPMVGRAVTLTIVPLRQDLELAMKKQGKAQGMPDMDYHQWVVEHLIEDDVLVANAHDKTDEGPMIGGNIATSIKNLTKRGGAVVWGAIRDLAQIEKVEGINLFYRSVHPTPVRNEVMISYNGPCLIGNAVCLPGDIVYACKSGVFFLPAHLVKETIQHAEKTNVRDIFGMERIAEKKYPTAQIDTYPWPQPMMDDFLQWFGTSEKARDFQHLDWSREIEETKTGHNEDHERFILAMPTIDYNDPRLD